jgi:hypothetical protein
MKTDNMDSESNLTLKSILLGKFSKEFLIKKWIPILTSAFFLFLIVAYLIYPENYSILLHSISFLGDYIDNPNGWWAFIIAMTVGTIMLFPLTLYYHRRLVKINKFFARLATFIGLICTFGMILVGIIADSDIEMWGTTMSKIHGPLAGAVFGGLAIAIILYGFIYLIDVFKHKQMDWKKNLIPYCIFLFAAFGMGISQLVKESMGLGWPKPDWPIEHLLLGFPFWEWMVLFCVWTFYSIHSIIMPEEFDKY